MPRSSSARRRTAILATLTVLSLTAALAGVGQAQAKPPPVGNETTKPAPTSRPVPQIPRHPVTRLCPADVPDGEATCFGVRRDAPASRDVPLGFGPADLRSAYNLADEDGGTDATVAVIIAFDNPNVEQDLAVYRARYDLPECSAENGCFAKVNQQGDAGPLPKPDKGWGGEATLQLTVVSAICPNCRLLVVEADSAKTTDLAASVNTAVALGATVVSNGWGIRPERGPVLQWDSLYFSHTGVAITAATGDDGHGSQWPATSRYVTAVGGTSLVREPTAERGWFESGWHKGGSGCSESITRPDFQADIDTGCGYRATSDVSAVADPDTGVAVYDSFGAGGWVVAGGTSAASALVAGVYGLAGTAGPADWANTYPYSHTAGLNDVEYGANGDCTNAVQCAAGTGWDGPTGLGTPNGVSAFAATATSCSGQKLGNPGFETGSAAPWESTEGVINSENSGQASHSGDFLAWLGGYAEPHKDSLSQTVTVPASCSATLTFWLHVDTDEAVGADPYDTLLLTVNGVTEATYSNQDAGEGFQEITVDLSPHVGGPVRIAFTGSSDDTAQTSFVIDDTALTLN